MRILVDCDGVLADLCTHLRTQAGVRSEITEMCFEDCLTPTELLQIQEEAPKKGFCRSIPWYVGAKNFLRDLQSMGDVYAVTAPWPLHDYDTWQSERRAWLEAGGVPANKVLSVPSICKDMVHGDVLIEDHPATCHAWLETHVKGTAILIDRPYNKVGSKVWEACGPHSRMWRADGYLSAIYYLNGGPL